MKNYALPVLLLSFLLLFSGCSLNKSSSRRHAPQDILQVHEKKTAAPWTAHGYQNVYRYFPSSGIYYDIGKGLYYYRRDDRWKTAASIPATLSASIDSYVTIKMNTDKPYTYHSEVQKKFPSGVAKKKRLAR